MSSNFNKRFDKSLGCTTLTLIVIGSIIGSGWLFGPFEVAKMAGPIGFFSWLIGGVMLFFVALVFAELAALMPVSGGIVRFSQNSHGFITSFTIAWVSYLASVLVAPIECSAIVQYAANIFPGLITTTDSVKMLSGFGIICSIIILFILSVINILGVRFFAKTSNILVAWKLLIPSLTIIVLFLVGFHSGNYTASSSGGFAPYGFHGLLASLPSAGVVYSFIGFTTIVQMAQEARNPGKDIPVAIIIALSVCIIIYVLVEIVFIGGVNPKYLANGWGHLSFKGDSGPMAGILGTIGIIWVLWFSRLLYIDAVISPFSTGLIFTASTARMNYGMSHNNYVPKFMLKLNKRMIPYWAIIINFFIGLIFFFPFPSWQKMVGVFVSLMIFAYLSGPVACLVFRKEKPKLDRPFTLPLSYLWCFISFYFCSLILYWSSWDVIRVLVGVIIVGYIYLFIYLLFVYYKTKILPRFRWKEYLWLLLYVIGICFLNYYGDFGVKHYIPFGWGFLVIAIFSLIIFSLAIFLRRKDIEDSEFS